HWAARRFREVRLGQRHEVVVDEVVGHPRAAFRLQEAEVGQRRLELLPELAAKLVGRQLAQATRPDAPTGRVAGRIRLTPDIGRQPAVPGDLGFGRYLVTPVHRLRELLVEEAE